MFDLPFLAQHNGGGGMMQTVDQIARTPLSQILLLGILGSVIRLGLLPVLKNTPAHRRIGFGRFPFALDSFVDAIVYAAVLIFFAVRPFLFQAFAIPSGSMLETLQIGDLIGINKAIYRYTDPQVGDIVVFRPPNFACYAAQLDEKSQPKVDFIKRCVGVPGDLVEIRQGDLYRNGQKVDEPYRRAPSPFEYKLVEYQGKPWPVSAGVSSLDGIPNPFIPKDAAQMEELQKLPPAKIPPGYFLMIGDNRPESFDGRCWGLVKREDVVGRADFIWWPSSRWRMLR